MQRTSVRGRLAAACLLMAGLASAACDVNLGEGGFHVGPLLGRASDQWTKSYPISPSGRFELKNVNGQITVEASAEAGTIEVTAERRARAGSDEAARELLKKIEIVETVEPDRVVLETRAPKSWGREGHEVKYVVKVPPTVQVSARTTNGGVHVKGLKNHVVASTVNGGVSGEGLSGQVEATTTNGGVEIALDALAAEGVKLETVNGGVQLTLPRSAKADISARVVNGGLHTGDLPIETVGEQNRRRLDGKMNGGGSRVELAAVNGGIHLSAQ
jgi:Putative adhesin